MHTLTHPLVPLPDRFTEYLDDYCAQARTAIESGKHHDQRRALLMDFLRKAFGLVLGDRTSRQIGVNENEALSFQQYYVN